MNIHFIDEYAWYPPGVKEALTSLQKERMMKTANRRPKLHKPTKGMKNFFKQQKNGLANAMRKMTRGSPETAGQNWFTPKAVRAQWLSQFMGGNQPHQGGQEKARRVRQMKEHKCINPEVWV